MIESPDTTALLIRHAHTDAIGVRLVGRAAGVALSSAGRAQADHLGRALANCPLAAIYSSPLQRAVHTAHAIARYQPAPLHVSEDFTEMDFGDWTGRTFEELAALPDWHRFNTSRACASVPNGESPRQVQQRVVGALARVADGHGGRAIAIVTHADVLRAAVLHYAGTSLDCHDRFEISPASVTAVTISRTRPRLLYVNNVSYAMPHERL